MPYTHDPFPYVDFANWQPQPEDAEVSAEPVPPLEGVVKEIQKGKPRCSTCDEEPDAVGYGYRKNEIFPMGEKCIEKYRYNQWFEGIRPWPNP